MPLTLKLIAASKTPIELDGISPDFLSGKTTQEVSRLPVWLGKAQVCLRDLFTVDGDASDGVVRLVGDLTHVHRVGARMQSGQLIVEGNVGMHAGAEMAGGELVIEGSAGAWLGAQLRGGKIHCHGNAGDGAGAAYSGKPLGMNGGTVIIDGNAGSHLGRRMRRGMIAVGGNAADCAGTELLAGTLIVRGNCSGSIGDGMRRGTIIILGEAPTPLPTFKSGGIHRPVFVRMIAKHLLKLGVTWATELLASRYACRHGDMLQMGRGELLERVHN
jgi:formylmethanofuran dehydrogenase subunit C